MDEKTNNFDLPAISPTIMKGKYLNKIFCMDCVEGMKEHLPKNSIDLVITDPPFAIDFKAKRSNYNRTKSRVFV